jgi:hypothetical protein
MSGVQLPTSVRLMNEAEYQLVSRVFADTLPYRIRMIITDAAGLDGRPFTIPTSLLSVAGVASAANFFAGAGLGYLGSVINFAYLLNVGSAYDSLLLHEKNLLVHETAHVWQGKNSHFALSYVFSSIFNQCVHQNAYSYVPGAPWSSYNAEQQASIVEDWFAAGQPMSGPLYPYITNHVRKGDA